MVKLMKDEKASLICLTTHKRNLLTQIVSPSKTREAIEFIPIPTLVFNAKN
jgi:nucleotide-binding universal stress UspA family protein